MVHFLLLYFSLPANVLLHLFLPFAPCLPLLCSAAADGSTMVRGPMANAKNWHQVSLTSPIVGSLGNEEVQFGELG
jgi:hypothetical protein